MLRRVEELQQLLLCRFILLSLVEIKLGQSIVKLGAVLFEGLDRMFEIYDTGVLVFFGEELDHCFTR